jgi:hypothetical protein
METILLAILSNDNTARAIAERQFAEFKQNFPRDVGIKLFDINFHVNIQVDVHCSHTTPSIYLYMITAGIITTLCCS